MNGLRKNILNITFLIFLTRFGHSRHVQLSIHTVVDGESDLLVKNTQFLEPEGKNKEKINYRNLCFYPSCFCLATGRQPGRFRENLSSFSRPKIWRSCPPPLWSHVNMRSKGGVHDLQIFGRENDDKFSQNLPGCLPVASLFYPFTGLENPSSSWGSPDFSWALLRPCNPLITKTLPEALPE